LDKTAGVENITNENTNGTASGTTNSNSKQNQNQNSPSNQPIGADSKDETSQNIQTKNNKTKVQREENRFSQEPSLVAFPSKLCKRVTTAGYDAEKVF